MKNLVTVGLVVLLAAGCLSNPLSARAPDTGLPPALVPPAWSSKLVGRGGDAETSLRISKDGQTVLGCSHGGFTKPSPLWASVDGGTTFKFIDPQPNPVVSGDCDVAFTDNGDWFIVYDTIASATVAASSDKGATWRFFFVAAPPVGGVDRPWIEAVGNDVYLFYADVMATEPFSAYFTKSSDGARTWSPPTLMGRFQSADESNCFMAHPVVRDAGKTIRVPITCWPGVTSRGGPFPEVINLLTSRNAGQSWATEKVAGPQNSNIRAISAAYAGPDGAALWIAYGTSNASAWDLQVIRSIDDGKTWSKPLVVATSVNVPLGWAWLDGRADGSVSMAWMDNHKPQNVTQAGTYWQPYAAGLTANGTVAWLTPVGPSAVGNTIYEFLMARDFPDGRAALFYAMPGDGCNGAPPTGTGQNRNNQCVRFSVEVPA